MFESKPIRSGLTFMSLLISLTSFSFLLLPIGDSPSSVMISAIVDFGMLVTSAIIFWIVVHIQYGDWDINRRYPPEE